MDNNNDQDLQNDSKEQEEVTNIPSTPVESDMDNQSDNDDSKTTKKNNNNKIIALVIGVFSIFAIIAIVLVFALGGNSNNLVIGDWKCKNLYGSGESNDYTLNLKINSDGSFVYDSLNNNFNVHGSYTGAQVDKGSSNNGYENFRLSLKPDDIVMDGISQSNGNKEINIEMSLEKGKENNAVVIFESSYSMYSCYK